ncbi:hypothetical protein [Streptomyces sp. NPDC058086]|uniref:hypothetical protein n=1 Tax=Streptomyces sp. NPDC058086 TaxID=3346334 RepID=UPI0036E31592
MSPSDEQASQPGPGRRAVVVAGASAVALSVTASGTAAASVGVRVNGDKVWDGHRAAHRDVKVVDGYATITALHAGAHHFTVTPR